MAVVRDGACQYFDEMTDLVQKEVEVLMDEDEVVIFKRDPKFDADWEVSRVDEVLNAALNDPEVDVVFAAGLLVAQKAGAPDYPLPKPVVSGFVQDPDTLGLPYDESGRSTKKNFNFVVVPLRSSRDLEEFYSLTPFTHLGIVADSIVLEGLNNEDVKASMQQIMESHHAMVDLLPVDKSAEELLERIPESVDAVYLTPALRMSAAEWQQVIDGINEKKLPTFSLMGHTDVQLGV
ncbi:MAG: hypothetical protein EOM20_19965, partial [Spartobacteria bacterium]|nr:hypothetical protein [Spartobacteria bacterium]